MISPRIDAHADSDIMPAPRHKTLARKRTMINTPATINMIKPWLTGNDEKDAKMLSRMFRAVGFSLGEWRTVVAEAKAA
jgi:hypothetical protein